MGKENLLKSKLQSDIGRILIWPILAWTLAALLICAFHGVSESTRLVSNRSAELNDAAFRLNLQVANALPPTSEEEASALLVEPAINQVHLKLAAADRAGMSAEDSGELEAAAIDLEKVIRKNFAEIRANRMKDAIQMDTTEVDPAFDRFEDAIAKSQRHVNAAASFASSVTLVATVTSIILCILVLTLTTYRSQTRSRKELEARLRAVHEAERANLAKSEFLSRMSHELRTPLNAVIGFAQLIPMQTDEPETVESAELILKAGRHLLDLVNEVLDLARIEAGKITISLEPVPLRDAVTQAIQLVLPTAQECGVAIRVTVPAEPGLHVLADRQRLVQVLINVVTNAAKYNTRGGRVEIRCAPHSGDRYRIEIQDTGPGIDEAAMARLFVPFERLGDQQAEGTGLGLALSRHLTELMGGELSLLTTTSEGSTFVVDLLHAEAPRVSKSESPDGTPSVFDQKRSLLRLVYIEDNLSNIQLMERVFSKLGDIEFIPAMQATTGLQLIEDHVPDVVLLDLHLPDGNGVDVLDKLKANPKTAQIPVIVLSADATNGQIQRLLDRGAKSYLTKPVELSTLFAELESLRPDSTRAA